MDSTTVLNIFKEITRIPRESGKEEAMTAYLQSFAVSHNLECKTDETGNVLITKPAFPGKEDVPVLVLQGHQDMVCEKNAGVQHDFSKDPINYVIEDGWMIARETTLGADDGIGVAACLAILSSDLPTGRIECLFTIAEETGMDGAEAIQEGFFSGKTLINLDSEEEGEFCIGCAGGVNTIARFPYDTENRNDKWQRMLLKISGGQGGHSGEDINKGRLNTIQALARFLQSEMQYGLQLIVISGGNKSNAIARECFAHVCVPDSKGTALRFSQYGSVVQEQHKESDPALRFEYAESGNNEKVLCQKDMASLINGLADCPHGVQAMSRDIPGLVETSTNLAAVDMSVRGMARVVTSQRSSITEECRRIASVVKDNFASRGAMVEHLSEYPGWKPDMNSHILEICVESYKKLFGKEPIVKAIHAGLECGLFLSKFPELDMISIGPTLLGIHAPGERLDLASLDKFTEHLIDVVCNFK